MIVVYTRHADEYYVKDGAKTSEVSIIEAAMRPVKQLYGHTLAKDFGPIATRCLSANSASSDTLWFGEGPDGKVQE